MPKELPEGIYEQIMTRRLRAALDETGYRTRRAAVEEEEGAAILTRHVAALLERSLNSLPEAQRLEKGVAICNEALGLLRKTVPRAFDDDGDELEEPATLLLELTTAEREALGQGLHAVRPLVPLSDYDLLTNASASPGSASARR